MIQPRQHIEWYDSGVTLCGKTYNDLGREPDCFSCLYSQARKERFKIPYTEVTANEAEDEN